MPNPLLIAFPLGLAAFALLIPLIIIYLRKPKPTEKTIPSLMFLIKELHKEKRYAFFRRLMRNLILILQLLILAALAFSVAEPFMKISKDIAAKNTVIVIDGSASMQALEGTSTRFENAKSKAKSKISGKTSVVLALDQPVVMLEQGGKSEALAVINSLQPKDTSTNIEGAMYEAENLLKNENGNVVVISDFITDNELDQPLKARRIISSKENSVEFIKVGKKVKNIGIINLELQKRSFSVHVKNYNAKEEIIIVKHIKGGKAIAQKEIAIKPGSIEVAEFQMADSISKAELDIKDSFAVDNTAYVSAPSTKKIKILLLTNKRFDKGEKSYLMEALLASGDIELEIRKPPIVKAYELNHDIIVIGAATEPILPADITDIADYIKKGHALIITAQDKLPSIKLLDLNPVNIGPALTKNTGIKIDIINEFTKDIDLNTTRKYFKANAKNNSLVVASIADNSPLISYMNYGNGKTFYYGIFDDYSQFKKTMSYPIFWNNVIKFLIETENVHDYNSKIGNINAVEFKKTGVYEVEGKAIAVNFLDEIESDINRDSEELEDEIKFIEKSTKRKTDFMLAIPLIIFAILLMLLELAYVKTRGVL